MKDQGYEPTLLVICPVCNALPGKPCTVSTEFFRRPVAWLHYARLPVDASPALSDLPPSVPPGSAGQRLS